MSYYATSYIDRWMTDTSLRVHLARRKLRWSLIRSNLTIDPVELAFCWKVLSFGCRTLQSNTLDYAAPLYQSSAAYAPKREDENSCCSAPPLCRFRGERFSTKDNDRCVASVAGGARQYDALIADRRPSPGLALPSKDYAEERSSELEVLESIFPDELTSESLHCFMHHPSSLRTAGSSPAHAEGGGEGETRESGSR